MKSSKLKLSESNLLFLLCICIPVMQLVNSLFLFDAGESSVGKIFRLIVFLTTLYIAITTSIKEMYWIILLLLVNIVVAFYQILNGLDWMEAFLNLMKLISPYVMISAFNGLVARKKIGLEYFDRILRFLLVFVPLSLIVPRLIGIGYERYEGSGYQGLYYENNALVLVLVVVYIFSLENLINKVNKKNLILSACAVFSVVINGSKSSMLFFVVITIAYFLRYIFIKNPKQFVVRFIILLVFMVGLVAVLYPMISSMLQKRIEAYQYYYTGGVLVNQGNVIDFFTNGRTGFVRYYIEKYYSDNSILNIVFGIQHYESIRVEMDPFDIFMYFGGVVFFILAIYILKAFWKIKNCSFMIQIMFCSTMVYSLLAGHVWNSSLSGLPYAIVLSIVISNKSFVVSEKNDELTSKYIR